MNAWMIKCMPKKKWKKIHVVKSECYIVFDLVLCLCVSNATKYYSYQYIKRTKLTFLVSDLYADFWKFMVTKYHWNICPNNIPHHHYNLIYIRCGDYWFLKSVKLCLFQSLTQSGQHTTGQNEFPFLESEWL